MSPEEIARIQAMLAMSPEEQAKAAAAGEDCLELAATTGWRARPSRRRGRRRRTASPALQGQVREPAEADREGAHGGQDAREARRGRRRERREGVRGRGVDHRQGPRRRAGVQGGRGGRPQDEAVDLVKGAPVESPSTLAAQTDDVLPDKVTATVAAVLETHSLTKVWGGATDAYNKAAAKVPGGLVKPIELDLPTYVVEQPWTTPAARRGQGESTQG